MDFNNFINNLCDICNSLDQREWNELLGEEPWHIICESFEGEKSFLIEMRFRVEYLIENATIYYQDCLLWLKPLNEDKDFTRWIRHTLYDSIYTPWYKYANKHHSFIEKLKYRNCLAPWRFK